jgi:hypothetical protein
LYSDFRKQVCMNHVNVSVTVAQASSETKERFATFLQENAPEAELTFTLRAPFDISALNVGLTLQRDVTARITPLGDGNGAYAVAWQPVVPGPFPAFAGTIFISSSEADESASTVTLDGHYHPPLGLAGELFDAVVGQHIAQASALYLLERIASGAAMGAAADHAPRAPFGHSVPAASGEAVWA